MSTKDADVRNPDHVIVQFNPNHKHIIDAMADKKKLGLYSF